MPKAEKLELPKDPLLEARNARNAYEQMKQSIKFFNDMLDFHIKQADAIIKREEKKEEEALSSNSQPSNS